jgi:(R)-2-hydroxyacyl-CoA dehydratese activating ATPase
MIHLLREVLGEDLIIPESPQYLGAYGAAILAGE